MRLGNLEKVVELSMHAATLVRDEYPNDAEKRNGILKTIETRIANAFEEGQKIGVKFNLEEFERAVMIYMRHGNFVKVIELSEHAACWALTAYPEDAERRNGILNAIETRIAKVKRILEGKMVSVQVRGHPKQEQRHVLPD